jgi:hypothetical protein
MLGGEMALAGTVGRHGSAQPGNFRPTAEFPSKGLMWGDQKALCATCLK